MAVVSRESRLSSHPMRPTVMVAMMRSSTRLTVLREDEADAREHRRDDDIPLRNGERVSVEHGNERGTDSDEDRANSRDGCLG